MSDVGESQSSTTVWRAVLLVGGVLLVIGGAALLVGLFADTLIWIWLSMASIGLGVPVLLVGLIGLLVTRSRDGQ